MFTPVKIWNAQKRWIDDVAVSHMSFIHSSITTPDLPSLAISGHHRCERWPAKGGAQQKKCHGRHGQRRRDGDPGISPIRTDSTQLGVKFGHCGGQMGRSAIAMAGRVYHLPGSHLKFSLVTLQGYTQTPPSHGVVFRRTPCCVEWASLDTICVSPEVGLLWINLECPGFTWRSNSRPLVCLEMGPQMVKNQVENGHLGTLFHPAHGE